MDNEDPNEEFDVQKDFLQAIQAQQQIMGSGFGTHDGAIMAGDDVRDASAEESEESAVESLSEMFDPVDVWAWSTPAQVEMPDMSIPRPEVPKIDTVKEAIDRGSLTAEAINLEMQELAEPLPMEETGEQANPTPPRQLPPFLQRNPAVNRPDQSLQEDDLLLGVELPESAEKKASSVNYVTPIPEVVSDPPGFPGDQPVSFNNRMQMGFRQDASDTLDDFTNALGDFLREFILKFTEATHDIQQMRDVLSSEVPRE